MRYKVRGREIRSENAAKPYSQRSKDVVAYLKQMPRFRSVLDFGCGKLRYSDLLIRLCKKAVFVDSHIQISRHQIVRGKRTTVARFVASRYPDARVLSLGEIDSHSAKYELITCVNVLSAIATARALRHALSTIRRLTKRHGLALFINQHRNSYFKTYETGEAHFLGYLYNGVRGHSYYGILDAERVKRLLVKHGFAIHNSWSVGEINFVEARPAL